MVFLSFPSWFLAISLIFNFHITDPQIDNFPLAFGNLLDQPQIINFVEPTLLDQSGGHLQGIQKYGEGRLFISGSSQSKSYLAEVLINRPQEPTKVHDLMPSPFRHAGGFQVLDHFLAIGIEDNIKRTVSMVHIYDLNLNTWDRPIYSIPREGEYERVTAGAVGLAYFKNQVILAVANWDSDDIDFYSCPISDFVNQKGEFTFVSSITSSTLNKENWYNTQWLSYQNINLFADKQGGLYLVGFAKNHKDQNVADLFELTFDPNLDRLPELRKINSRVFHPINGADFKAGAGISVNKHGQIILLASPYLLKRPNAINLFQ